MVKKYTSAFTIVELIVVIVVIGIISTVSVVGYGQWQRSLEATQLKSDLNGVASAMESYKNFNNAYPSDVLTVFTPSDGVSIGGGSHDGLTYCVDAVSIKDSSVKFYIEAPSSSSDAQAGSCADRPVIPSVPNGLASSVVSSSAIDLSWNASVNADNYIVQRATNSGFSDAQTIATQSSTSFRASGLQDATTYFFRVKAVNDVGESGWSSSTSSTTHAIDNFATLQWTEHSDLGNGWGDVAVSANGSRVVIAKSGSTRISNDAGVSWPTTHSNLTMNAVSISADGTRMVGVLNTCGPTTRYSYSSSNSGASWTSVNPPIRAFSMVSSSSGQIVVASGCEWDYNVSTDYGSTWIGRSIPGVNYIGRTTISADGNRIFVAGTGMSSVGNLNMSTDNGVSWTAFTNLGSAYWEDVAVSADGAKILTIARNGLVYTSSNAGSSWVTRSSAGSRNWKSVASSADGTKLVAGVGGGYIYTSKDSGATWTEHSSLGTKSWSDLEVSSDGSKIFAIGSGVLYTGQYGP